MTVSELLPCPFCGHEPKVDNYGPGQCVRIYCNGPDCSAYPSVRRYSNGNAAALAGEGWNTRAMKAAEPLQQGDDLRERFASLESDLVMLHRATQEADPHRELTIRVEDALAELRAIIAPITAIGSQSIEGERG